MLGMGSLAVEYSGEDTPQPFDTVSGFGFYMLKRLCLGIAGVLYIRSPFTVCSMLSLLFTPVYSVLTVFFPLSFVLMRVFFTAAGVLYLGFRLLLAVCLVAIVFGLFSINGIQATFFSERERERERERESRVHVLKRFCSLTSCGCRIVPFLGRFDLWNSKLQRHSDDPTSLAAQTVFSVSEVEALRELFKKLSNTLIEDGLIHKEEFQLALFQNSKRQNLFADRMFTLFDLKKNGVIEFGEFVRSLSIFHPKTPLSEKIDFTFRLYDLRQTGFIEREDVEEMLVALLSEAELELSEEAISTILDKTFQEADTNQDGRIDHAEWRTFALKYPALMKIMTLSYLKDVTTAYPSFIFKSEVKNLEKHEGRRSRRHVSDMEG